jgi:hypothetical protein
VARPLALISDALASVSGMDGILRDAIGLALAYVDATYGHLAPDAEERERELLDAYDLAASARAESGRS